MLTPSPPPPCLSGLADGFLGFRVKVDVGDHESSAQGGFFNYRCFELECVCASHLYTWSAGESSAEVKGLITHLS